MGSNWEMARHQAWREFGSRYWRWFVFGPIIGRVLGVLIVLSGLGLGVLYVVQHAGAWLTWLGWVSSNYLLPMLFVALGVTLYAILAVIIWRLNGWRWKFRGFSTARYTLSCASFIILVVLIIGVSL